MASFRDPTSVAAYEDAFVKVFSELDDVYRHALSLDYAEPWETHSRLW